MPAALSIPATFVSLLPDDQTDLEGLGSTSAKSSTSSVNVIPHHVDEHHSIIRDAKVNPDGAAQIVASVWSKHQLIAAYVLLWFICAVTSIFSNILDALGPYVTSAFHLHSYAAATGIVANVVGALCTIPTSKLLQRWGRAQGLAIMLIIWMIGLIMLAACREVWTFAAAQVFASIGSTGASYCVSVFVADTTSLRNRGLMISFSTSPDIITMWIGGPVASSLLKGIGWRWGFGIFVLALPVVVLPFWALILWNQRKARKVGLLPDRSEPEENDSKETAFSVVKKFAIEVDLVGLLMLASGISLFLLPFTLYSFQKARFGSPLIVSLLSVGVALIIGFALYERFLAPTAIIQFSILVDRTVLCAIATATLTVIGFTLIIGYVTSLLQVVYGCSVTQTSYLVSSIRVAICFWTLLIGLLARWTGRVKLLMLMFGMPFMIVAACVWLHFNRSDRGGLVVMVFVILLVSFGLGTTTLTCTLIMMAALGQANITVVLALTVFVGNIAPAIGEAINTGIWTGIFKTALEKHLPGMDVNQIYSSLDVQLSFPKGSPIRNGIAEAYGDAKFYMLVTSLCVLSIAMLTTLCWRDLRVKEVNIIERSGSRL